MSIWLSVDPLSHLDYDKTPYHFVANNPVMRIDPNGLTHFVNGETGEMVSVDDGMNQEVTVDAADWDVAIGHSQMTDGINPDEMYNAFIQNNGGTKVPTRSEGGWIEDWDMLAGFMQFRAGLSQEETTAWELKREDDDNSVFYVMPWEGNKVDYHRTSPPPSDNEYGYTPNDAIRLFQSHPDIKPFYQFGMSDTDWTEARNLSMENVAIYPNGSMWIIHPARREDQIPRPRNWNGSYGKPYNRN